MRSLGPLAYVVASIDETIVNKAKTLNQEFHHHPHVALEATLCKLSEAVEQRDRVRSSGAYSNRGQLEIVQAISWLQGCLEIVAHHRSHIQQARQTKERTISQNKLLRKVTETWQAADQILLRLSKEQTAAADEFQAALASEQLIARVLREMETLQESTRLVSWRRKHAQSRRRLADKLVADARQQESQAQSAAVTPAPVVPEVDPQLAQRDAELRDGYIRGM